MTIRYPEIPLYPQAIADRLTARALGAAPQAMAIRCAWRLSRGFHDWFMAEIKDGRAKFPALS